MMRRRSTTRALAALLLALAMLGHTVPAASAIRAPRTQDCTLAAAPSGSYALAVAAPRDPTLGTPASRRSPSPARLPRPTTIADAHAETPPRPPLVPRARSRTTRQRGVAPDDPLPH